MEPYRCLTLAMGTATDGLKEMFVMPSVIDYINAEINNSNLDYPIIEIPVDVAKYIVKALSCVESKPIQKDEHHFYCGECEKRINLKTKPRFCCKCGAKILW